MALCRFGQGGIVKEKRVPGSRSPPHAEATTASLGLRPDTCPAQALESLTRAVAGFEAAQVLDFAKAYMEALQNGHEPGEAARIGRALVPPDVINQDTGRATSRAAENPMQYSVTDNTQRANPNARALSVRAACTLYSQFAPPVERSLPRMAQWPEAILIPWNTARAKPLVLNFQEITSWSASAHDEPTGFWFHPRARMKPFVVTVP